MSQVHLRAPRTSFTRLPMGVGWPQGFLARRIEPETLGGSKTLSPKPRPLKICMTSFCHVALVTYRIFVSGALSKGTRVVNNIYLHMVKVYDLLYLSKSLILIYVLSIL